MSPDRSAVTLGERLNTRHPFTKRVVDYVTAETPYAAGWYGAGHTDDFIPDELRAVGATVVGGSGGTMTVTLPAAAANLPLPAGRTWASVTVEVLNAYTALVTDGLAALPLRAPTPSWSTATLLPGSLAGGAVNFTGLPAGFYVARATWTTSNGVTVRAYQGRPVQVTA